MDDILLEVEEKMDTAVEYLRRQHVEEFAVRGSTEVDCTLDVGPCIPDTVEPQL